MCFGYPDAIADYSDSGFRPKMKAIKTPTTPIRPQPGIASAE